MCVSFVACVCFVVCVLVLLRVCVFCCIVCCFVALCLVSLHCVLFCCVFVALLHCVLFCCVFVLLHCVHVLFHCVHVCVFPIVQGHIVLESVQYRGQHVGVLPDGTVKEPGRTGTGQHAQFVLTLHKSTKVSLLLILTRTFCSPASAQFVFVEGSVVILESCASGKSLRSYHGTAQGVGGKGLHGIVLFVVDIRRRGKYK